MEYFLLVVGFVILIKGADYLIDSSSKIAKAFGVSPFIIGISIVAFGTSAPEAVVGVISSFAGIKNEGANEIVLGTIVGSSIANVAFILGAVSLLSPIKLSPSVLKKELPLSLLVQILLLSMTLLDGVLSKIDGVILLLAFVVFLYYLFRSGKNQPEQVIEVASLESDKPQQPLKERPSVPQFLKLSLIFLIGLTGLLLGGDMVVDNSTKIAVALGLSQAVIGLTIVALGTSLPELVASIVAIRKKEDSIAIGNIIGSNIFNILFILSISSMILPIKLTEGSLLDIVVMILSTILYFVLAYNKSYSVSRLKGLFLVLGYLGYMIYKLF